MRAVGFACIQIILADINGLAAVGAGHFIERLAGDVIILGIIVAIGVLILSVLAFAVFVLLLVQICFQIFQLIAQVVDLVVGA